MSLVVTFWTVPEVSIEALFGAAQPEERQERRLFWFSKVKTIDRFPALLADCGIPHTFDEGGGDCFLALEMYLADTGQLPTHSNLFDNEASRRLSRARNESWWVVDQPEAARVLAILHRLRPTHSDLFRFLEAEYPDASPAPEPVLRAYETLLGWLTALKNDHRGLLHVG